MVPSLALYYDKIFCFFKACSLKRKKNMHLDHGFLLFQVLNNAMSLVVSKYWDKAQFKGCKIKTSLKPYLANEEPFTDYATVHKVNIYFI